MSAFYQFLATYAGLIYILLALSGLFALRWLWKSWRELQDSVFGLEREFALRRLSQSLIVSLLILIGFVAEMFMASFVPSTIPAAELVFTPTLEIHNEFAGTPVSDTNNVSTTLPPNPQVESDGESGCIPGQLDLTSPKSGQEVSGIVTLVGTVIIDNFGFYKYEISPSGSDAWATISAGKEIVKDGEVGLWDTSTLTPGDYQLSLEVMDNEGRSYPPCIISVRVVAQ